MPTFLWFTPIEGLTLGGGITYTDAQFGRLHRRRPGHPGQLRQLSLLPGAGAVLRAGMVGTSARSTIDRNDRQWSARRFQPRGQVPDDYNTGSDLLPYKSRKPSRTLNGRIIARRRGRTLDRWKFWAQNLTDEEYVQVAYNAPLQGGPPSSRRSSRTGPSTTRPATARRRRLPRCSAHLRRDAALPLLILAKA
jgi:iron complex outermembrane receptor protein